MQVQAERLEILVVDDQEENLAEMQELLEELDRTVHCADSGAKALACMTTGKVGLVLMDVQMPGMDGFAVARRMRDDPTTRFTPIIFISGLRQTDDVLNQGYAAGAVDFMTKPVHPTMLLHKARVLLEHDHYRRGLLQTTQQLEQQRSFNASILNNTAEGILVVGSDGRIRFANPAITRMLGCSESELQGSELIAWVESPHEDTWQDSVWLEYFHSGETLRLHDANLRNREGQTIPVALSCSPLLEEQDAMTLLALDMSSVRELHRQLEIMTITDALTGLLNRRGFLQALQAAIARNQRTGRMSALLYLDLDGFKQINDKFGHDRGDEALRWVSGQLKGCLRPYDRLARIGGDEFTIIIEGIDSPDDAAAVADKLIAQVGADHENFLLGASIGIACLPTNGTTVEELMRAADGAMYEAKHRGKGQYRFAAGQQGVAAGRN
ncbi:diguanylate cyclase [Pseudomonas gingeri]|uniref:Diguanylate cyclase n=1 Tax=Pseudomonas gingeri TaxID=117681 RepID=A0A7Y7YBF4_9PSED|nr:diguanylate cyclase [Pseudomonas gingeri]NWB26719.1 diguanylate cyclase [Pseudomonas gingeri]NWC32731.1 diguanylate cyclase [Pseudomonas gingeri]NWD51746.1 diguanylate cyclase [Pseudomonas gingeri]